MSWLWRDLGLGITHLRSKYLATCPHFDLVNSHRLQLLLSLSVEYTHCTASITLIITGSFASCLPWTQDSRLQFLSPPQVSFRILDKMFVFSSLEIKEGRKAPPYDTMMVLIYLLKCLGDRTIYIPDFDGQNVKCLPVQLVPRSPHGLEQLLQVPYSRKKLHITPHHWPCIYPYRP